jgi:beta-fructofuranosidase
VERVCASGGTVVEPQRVVAFYPGWEAGQMVAVASDPLLLNWEKLRGRPVNAPASGDSCIWKEGETYFGLVGCRTLLTSQNLIDWKVRNRDFLGGSSFLIDDGSCPTFLPLGNKHILLLFSHSRGGQYLLGDYDRGNARFVPYEHGRFNHGMVAPGGVHAPSGVADGKGGVINILNLNDGKHSDHWDQLLSLAQRLTLGPDKRLRLAPVEAVATLRTDHRHLRETLLPANRDIVLPSIQGNALELDFEIDPKQSRWVQLDVLRSSGGEERTSITFYNYDRKLSFWYLTPGVICLDGSRSSTLPDVWPRPPERAILERGSEPLRLRVFVDRSVVEVFANGKLYLGMRVYPGRADSLGVSLRAQGQEGILKRLDAWRMRPIGP